MRLLPLLALLAPLATGSTFLLAASPSGDRDQDCDRCLCLEAHGDSGGLRFHAEYTECEDDGKLDLKLRVWVQSCCPDQRMHLSKNGQKFYLFWTDEDGRAELCLQKNNQPIGPDGRPAGRWRCDDWDTLRVFGGNCDAEGMMKPCRDDDDSSDDDSSSDDRSDDCDDRSCDDDSGSRGDDSSSCDDDSSSCDDDSSSRDGRSRR